MRFEPDKHTAETVKLNVYVYIAFIGIALGLAARYCFSNPPRYLISVACLACGVYMGICLLRFVRMLKTCENAFLGMNGDRIRGLSVDPGKGTGEPFEIGLDEVEDVSLQELKLTRRTLLPTLSIRTSDRTYRIVGIDDMRTARSKLLPDSWE